MRYICDELRFLVRITNYIKFLPGGLQIKTRPLYMVGRGSAWAVVARREWWPEFGACGAVGLFLLYLINIGLFSFPSQCECSSLPMWVQLKLIGEYGSSSFVPRSVVTK